MLGFSHDLKPIRQNGRICYKMEKNGGNSFKRKKNFVVRGTLIGNNARSVGALKVFGHFGILRRGVSTLGTKHASLESGLLSPREMRLSSLQRVVTCI